MESYCCSKIDLDALRSDALNKFVSMSIVVTFKKTFKA